MTAHGGSAAAASLAEQKAAAANREMRIAVRRQRIANRLLVLSSQGSARPKSINDEKEEGPALVQLTSSLQSLSFLKKDLANEVNRIRGGIDYRECKHQAFEETRCKELHDAQEETRLSCAEQNSNLSQKWDSIAQLQVPQELADQIASQKKACDAVLESKEKLMDKVREVLKVKVEEYHNAAIQQAKDVDTLVLSMGKQVVSLSGAYIKEFHDVEEAFLVQRMNLITSNKTEMEGLIKKMRAMEAQFQETLFARGDEYSAALDETRLQDSEDYNFLKVKLETDVQTLEQHLESMQAAYQMNTEKLDYNYRVLVERENDNYVTAGQQKRKLTRLRDIQTNLRTKHSELERRFKWQNAKLADDYARVTRLLQDLQNKEHELTTGHENQYLKFYAMHQHDLAVLVSRVLQADKIIHEQHLGWRWHPPDAQLFIDIATPGPVDAVETDSKPSTPEIGLTESITPAIDRPMLEMLRSELEFVLGEEAKKFDEGLELDDGNFAKSVSILQALGITSGLTLEKLRKFVTTAPGKTIHNETLVARLQQFLKEHRAESPADGPSVPKLHVVGGKKASQTHRKPNRMTDEQKKWKRFATVIDLKVVHTFPALDIAVLKYNQILKDRVMVAREIESLTWQNEELRKMLRLCLSSKAHDELYVSTLG